MNLLLCFVALVSSLSQTLATEQPDSVVNMTFSDTEYEMNFLKRQTAERPKWMEEKWSRMQNWKINKIAMPGSHHSGFLNPITWGIYKVCQSRDIHNQLHMGVRWFDFRVDRNIHGKMVFSHSGPSTNEVYPQLYVIRDYLATFKKEIVILHVTKDTSTTYRDYLTTKMIEVFGSMIVTKTQYETMTYSALVNANARVIITGDYAPNLAAIIPVTKSWSVTQNGNWGTVVNNCINWLKTTGLSLINGGRIAVASAYVTPTIGQDITAPKYAAPDLNNLMRTELPKITNRINVVEHDFVDQALISTIIDFNDKFT